MSDDRDLWKVTPIPRESVTLDGWEWKLDHGLLDVVPAPEWMPGHVVMVFDPHHFDASALGEIVPYPPATD